MIPLQTMACHDGDAFKPIPIITRIFSLSADVEGIGPVPHTPTGSAVGTRARG
ncbi:hypothetical protein HNR23_001615 [Nocardiopsis mwathae]|uniref:Uncharacterized protein n=1 Tax=Nocardiopsis mwathae TaxID=1472723 RepID=A0A7W9YGJ6_9ACTN|nr:hypothetical protein [Nocardiopsis mwathae]